MSESKKLELDQSPDNCSWLELCDAELNPNKELSKLNQTIEEGEIVDSTFESEPEPEPEPKKVHTGNNAVATILSYAKVVSQGSKAPKETPIKSNPVNVPTEDLSLTSHLDVFHVESPCKKTENDTDIQIMLDEDTIMFSPVKEESAKNMKRPFKLIDSPLQEKRERTNSIHSTHKVAKANIDSDVHTTNNDKLSSPGSKRELEVNPDVLVRRQKQIDYGKNTVGYEKYLKAVPKHKRTKEHPKTPPKHLKMSRRAWDGLVKNWRLKLHRWDPVEENDDLDWDSASFDRNSLSSEVSSSYDSNSVKSDSTPSTPNQSTTKDKHDLWNRRDDPNQSTTKDRKSWKHHDRQEKSKELWPNCPRKSDKSDDDDYLGCESLNENYVKCS